MNKRALLVCFGLWVSLLGLGVKWSANPILKPPGPNLQSITLKETAKAYPLHIASFRGNENSLLMHSRELDEDDDPKPAPPFDYESWAFREMRIRLTVFLVFWTAGGLIVHWTVYRIFREPRKTTVVS